MSVNDGQPVNAAVSNASWISKNTNDSTPSILGFSNSAPSSGTTITNGQREYNSLNSFVGSTPNAVYNQLPTWTNNQVGLSTDSLFVRTDELTQRFSGSAGHTHDGTDGNGPTIVASGISGLRSGTEAVSSGVKFHAASFSTTLGTTSYSVVCTLNNLVDSTPQFQPVTITAKSATGFTASWDQATDSSNYQVEYLAIIYA